MLNIDLRLYSTLCTIPDQKLHEKYDARLIKCAPPHTLNYYALLSVPTRVNLPRHLCMYMNKDYYEKSEDGQFHEITDVTFSYIFAS